MKEIVLKFKTEKGEKAYHKVDAEGKAQSFLERQIAKKVARDILISKKPLIVKIKIKVKRLAVQVKLDEQVEIALKKFGAVKGIDYELEVRY